MLIQRPSSFLASVFVIILYVTTIHGIPGIPSLGSESPVVDQGTIENLKKNISDYLVELEHGGSPQMHLKQIYSASKQIVTGTLYTVEALIATPDGNKKCNIRVLEKPWLDFCKVSLTCENGGYYEVTFNPNQDNIQNLPIANYFPTSAFQKPVEVQKPPIASFKPQQTSVFKAPLTIPAQQKYDFKPQGFSQFPVNNFVKTQSQSHVTVAPAFKAPPTTLAPQKFEFKPQVPSQFAANNYVKPQNLAPVPQKFEFKQQAQSQFPVNNFVKPQNQSHGIVTPGFKAPFTTRAPPKFEFKPQVLSQFAANSYVKPQNLAPAPQKFEFKPQIPSQFTANNYVKPQSQSNVKATSAFKAPQAPTKFEFKPQLPSQFTANNYVKSQNLAPVTQKFEFKQQGQSQFPVNNFAKPQSHVAVTPGFKAPFTTRAPPKFEFKPQVPSQFTAHNYVKPQNLTPVPQKLTPAPQKFDFKPQTQTNQPSPFDFKPRPIQNVPAVLPLDEILPPVPQQPFEPHHFKPEIPPKAIDIPHAVPHSPAPAPAPASSPAELNVLPFNQLPQGEALNTYLDGLFHDFMIVYKREYINEPHEMQKRFDIFKENFNQMIEHSKGDQSAEYSVTQFSDLSQSEFERILGFDTGLFNVTDTKGDSSGHGKSYDGSSDGSSHDGQSSGSDDEIPEKYDQRDENLVTRVKHQGDCGACWAFITSAVIEGLCAKRTKKLQEFSEQSLIDCDNSNYGCKGGVPVNAYKHIFKRGGLELESVYPYVYGKSTCHFDPKTVKVKVSGGQQFKKGDEENMAKWLYKNGPIAVGINAAPLKYYKRGILDPSPPLCPAKKIDHGVTLIGYGVEVNKATGEKIKYWIAKNSWGTTFGEDGYVRIIRGKNACGLALWATSAKLANVENNCLLQGA